MRQKFHRDAGDSNERANQNQTISRMPWGRGKRLHPETLFSRIQRDRHGSALDVGVDVNVVVDVDVRGRRRRFGVRRTTTAVHVHDHDYVHDYVSCSARSGLSSTNSSTEGV
jgi:hypothetical protein